MAYLATKRFNYWSQLGILTAFIGIGLIIGQIAGIIPLLGKIDFSNLKGLTSAQIMDDLFKPENTSALRWMQIITTVFLFFLPPVFYALLCHKKPFVHLGYRNRFNIPAGIVVIFIMLAALPMVSGLQDLTEMLPWSKATLLKFKSAEDEYNKIVIVMARMNSFSDYLISVLIIALLPAVFEETLFRGAIQNLFSRWFKMPIIAIAVTAAIFSLVHGSYLGFLSRFALGFVLGWIFHRTGNIWLNIVGHFFNNAFALTVLYMSGKAGGKLDLSKMEDHFPQWALWVSIAFVVALFVLFDNLSKKEIDHPGEELPMPGVAYSNNPFINDNPGFDKTPIQ